MSAFVYKEAFRSFDTFKILVVGDVMLDAYAWGKVARISPEAPVPVLACDKRENRLGGAANVAKNIKSLGAEATICTVIGEDAQGDSLLRLFQKNSLNTNCVIRASERRTTVKTRFLSGSHHLLRVDEEDISYISDSLESQLYSKIEQELEEANYNALIFQDYDKGVLTPTLIEKLKSLAQQKGLFTIVDPKKRNFSLYSGTSLFKPNFKEFVEGAGLQVTKRELEKLIGYAQIYRQEHSIQYLLLTLSEQGVLICSKEGAWHIPAQVCEIADVSGAGDTVVATATLCLAAGLSAEKLAVVSNMAGSLVCKHPVVVSVDKDELYEAINEI